MSRLPLLVPLLFALAAGAAPADAQERGRGRDRVQGIPPGHLPPPGMCRVWYDDRPPGHQPPPVSCRRAEDIAEDIRGARVIYGGNVEPRDREWEEDEGRPCDEWERRRGECDWPDEDDWEDDARGGRDRVRRAAPAMVWGAMYARGRRVDALAQWLPSGASRAELRDADRDGTPDVVTWLDRRGMPLRRWIDDDDDGYADRIGIYRNGRLARVVRP